jgi:hypothetical protein
VDKLLADTIPAGWIIRHTLYITNLDDPRGETRAYASIAQAGDGRRLLVASSRATSPKTRVIWDPVDPSTPGKLRRWLGGIAAAPPPPRRDGSDVALHMPK